MGTKVINVAREQSGIYTTEVWAAWIKDDMRTKKIGVSAEQAIYSVIMANKRQLNIEIKFHSPTPLGG